MLGSCPPLSGWDGFRVPAGLVPGEDPESGLREMAGDSTHGDGVPLSVALLRSFLRNVPTRPLICFSSACVVTCEE